MHSLPYWVDAIAMDYARHLVGDQSRKTMIGSVYGIVQGPSGARLQLRHGQRGSHSSLDEVGHLLLNICSCTPQVATLHQSICVHVHNMLHSLHVLLAGLQTTTKPLQACMLEQHCHAFVTGTLHIPCNSWSEPPASVNLPTPGTTILV